MDSRIEGIRKLLADPVDITAPNNQARGWRTDCEQLLTKVDGCLLDLSYCAKHLRTLVRYCEACEGSGEIIQDDDTAEDCSHCKPIWVLIQRIDPPKPPPMPVIEERDDDIAF